MCIRDRLIERSVMADQQSEIEIIQNHIKKIEDSIQTSFIEKRIQEGPKENAEGLHKTTLFFQSNIYKYFFSPYPMSPNKLIRSKIQILSDYFLMHVDRNQSNYYQQIKVCMYIQLIILLNNLFL
eukprot:TRINITY_DN7018_c0_g1_i1.p3 TRINITY_DN7018_c0_g1~~TRINITY_DN7018_c0_g1_i1.p3  ORF type:complete len:125 (+),score=22.52 TRINITY_DN7018_c0_g1_i1:77-451(+)